MKQNVSIMVIGLLAAAQASAQDWTFTPEIYARGGVTYKSDFSREAGRKQYESFNVGPYLQESLIDYPLTEVTVHAAYGDELTYHLGFDVNENRRFLSKDDSNEKSPFMERVNYLEFKLGEHSKIWGGNRPFRSPPEFLSRAFLFDEKNILGGGVRFEQVGPVNVDLAYGSFENNYVDSGVSAQEHTNVVINKFEVPLSNGMVKTNLEIQQTKRTTGTGDGEAGTHGYLAGVAWQRWGDQVFGGGLYNQFIVHTSSGYVSRTAMSSAFNQFDPDQPASKYLLAWNGDWKMERFALYWLGLYQKHGGKREGVSSSEFTWETADAMVRPVYALTPQLNVGVEWDRRSVLKEGKALSTTDFSWAANGGSTRFAGLLQYTLKNRNFNSPTIGLFAGEVRKDKATRFYASSDLEKSTHFVHFFYEVKIN